MLDRSDEERQAARLRQAGRMALIAVAAAAAGLAALDGLQVRLGGPRFEVVAINIDTRDPDKPKAWLREAGVDHLAYYADPSAKVFQDLKAVGWAFGMP